VLQIGENIGGIMYTRSLFSALPKTDLHCHLDGSLRLDTLIDLAKTHNVKLPSNTPSGLRELVYKENYTDLMDYLHGFAYTCAVMVDAEAIERISFELGEDCLAEGVFFLEVRFAPQLFVRDGFGVDKVLAAVAKGLDRVRSKHILSQAVLNEGMPGFQYSITACAMRMFTKGFGPYYSKLLSSLEHSPAKEVFSIASLQLARAVVDARDRLGIPVVAFDLAGAEAGFPASDHIAAYDYLNRHFFKKTVHAGEAYGPQSIFQAMARVHADRIGHGTHLYRSDMVDSGVDGPEFVRLLAEHIADRRITLEVCITSNMQTMPELSSVADHPLGRMVKDRISVTLCTDNRLVSNTTVTDELVKATAAFDFSPLELRNVILHGFKRSFFPGSYKEKRAYVRTAINYYDKIASEHGLPAVGHG
jgi:adenosine deaminase